MRKSDKNFDPFTELPVDGIVATCIGIKVIIVLVWRAILAGYVIASCQNNISPLTIPKIYIINSKYIYGLRFTIPNAKIMYLITCLNNMMPMENIIFVVKYVKHCK